MLLFIQPLNIGEKMSTAILAPAVVTLDIGGVLTVASTPVSGVVNFAAPFSGTITAATVAVAVAPTGAALKADLMVGTGIAARSEIAVSTTSATSVLNTASYAVTNKALTSNVATLTTAAHGYKVGDIVTVNGVGQQFDGTFAITVIGSTTTFSYAKIANNVSSVASSGGTASSNSPVKFNAGDVIKVSVTQVGSSVAGSNLVAAFTVTEG
jgi:hypothetical protein